ncbi:uncharacterized protein LOC115241682 [Formica exsecta]|uniref:uncharacterized protein LOC115241682 n=1 Tax=Formica exsecta TaxID=72781 RepID=UPI0011436F9F|nr:uncharacterized protein LOC115241682 [Formica exsecta]
MTTLLQVNLNHARQAQDLFSHSLMERGCGIGVAAEPYFVPQGHPCWASDQRSSVAITWLRNKNSPPASRLENGEGYVAVQWGRISVVGVYISPNIDLARFEDRLQSIGECIRRSPLPRPVIIARDFNAKSALWGSPLTNRRGGVLEDWASLGLCIFNRGSRSTCVRPQGESIVDLTWAAPAAVHLVSGWEVLEKETASDHLYIKMTISAAAPEMLSRRRDLETRPRRWVLRKMDENRLKAAILSSTWPEEGQGGKDADQQADWLRDTLTDACDVAMPRAKSSPRRAAYWWTEEIATLRRASIRTRRDFMRARRRRSSSAEEVAEKYGVFRVVRDALVKATRAAKAKAWTELLQTLEEDLWGRPYHIL